LGTITYTYIRKKNKMENRNQTTKIPKYSLRITLNEMKEWLNNKWKQYKNNDY